MNNNKRFQFGSETSHDKRQETCPIKKVLEKKRGVVDMRMLRLMMGKQGWEDAK